MVATTARRACVGEGAGGRMCARTTWTRALVVSARRMRRVDA